MTSLQDIWTGAPRPSDYIVDHEKKIGRERHLWAAVDREVIKGIARKARAMVSSRTTPMVHVDQCVKGWMDKQSIKVTLLE